MELSKFLFVIGVCFLLVNCEGGKSVGEESLSENAKQEVNPAADGFNEANSDEKAIQIADEVMEKMGGRKNWDQTRFLAWNFFGRRHLLWDKKTGDVRVTMVADSAVYLINVQDDSKNQIFRNGQLESDQDSIQKYANQAKSIWINDSYWLVMPFKLKDSGVTLKYLGEDTTAVGAKADKLQLTFEAVGKTPENKYVVYVDAESRLITQWDYYKSFEDEKPVLFTPWENYQPHGGILLSDGRGGKRKLTEIAVFNELPSSIFTSIGPVDLEKFKAL